MKLIQKLPSVVQNSLSKSLGKTMKKHKKKIIFSLIITSLFFYFFVYQSETIAKTMTSPDSKFKLIITKTKEHFPYGVEGHIYISDLKEENKTKVESYFTDDLGELNAYLNWDEKKKAYLYTGRYKKETLINLDYTPLKKQ